MSVIFMTGSPTSLIESNRIETPPFGNFQQGKVLIALFALALLFMVGCSASNRKVHIQHVGEYGTQFRHSGSEIQLWTDLDVEFAEPDELNYRISFYQGGELVAEVSCNPMAVQEKQMHRYVEDNGLVKVSYLGQMQCGVDLPEGETFVSVHFEALAENLRIFRADLIIK